MPGTFVRHSRNLVLGLLALLVGGCGEPSVGGSGDLRPGSRGGPDSLLRVEGTPYEMGWWHGHVLRGRIERLHREWQSKTFGDEKEGLRRACVALLPEIRSRLPERIGLELKGLAAGCGMREDDLLLTEVMRDALRFLKKAPDLMTGVLSAGATEARLALGGRWADLLDAEWIVLDRHPTDGTPSTDVITWPGSLGAVAGARGGTLAFLSAEVALDPGRDGLNGVPFGVSARLALEKARDPEGFLAACSRTTGRRVLALDLATGRRFHAVLALTGEDPVDVTGTDWRAGPEFTGVATPTTRLAEVALAFGSAGRVLTFLAAGSSTAVAVPLTD